MSIASVSRTQDQPAQPVAQPPAPGIWYFTGIVHIPARGVHGAIELLFDDWPFRIVQGDQGLVISDVESGVPFGGEWVGSWVAKDACRDHGC